MSGRIKWLLCATVALMGVCAYGDTLQDIITNVSNNVDATMDMTATADYDFGIWTSYDIWNIPSFNDMDNATTKLSLGRKFRIEGTGGDVRTAISNGTTNWLDTNGDGTFVQKSCTSYELKGGAIGWLPNIKQILANNTWTLAPAEETVNGVLCRKIYCADFNVWVDTATLTKVMKIEDSSTDYTVCSGYTYVSNKAYVPSTMTHYRGGTYVNITYSSVTIDQTLPAATWAP